jgi:phosphate:Na+ symporter
MDSQLFTTLIAPVIGGLGFFMLGLDFMESGIQALSVNKMRATLAKVAGTPVKGLVAGTCITGVLQSSTAMTVMVVGLVNAGVIALRPAISVIMGANIGTTLGNGLIALPLGPLGLVTAGLFALIYCFSKTDKVKNIALSVMGFALIFYGLNLLTGGLKPLRDIPAVMDVLSTLKADSFANVIVCTLIAALVTALIHSSSATIGIVMGLGLSGILPWQTAVAFSLGADLGTTVTSWIASINLSKNAKRAAYAHIAFNFIGVGIMLPLFFPAMDFLEWGMAQFGAFPGEIKMVDGKETFPMVPLAVGAFSIGFNIFNTIMLFPFIGVFERVLLKVGHSEEDEAEDYSIPKYLNKELKGNLAIASNAVQLEINRNLRAGLLFIDMARGTENCSIDPDKHYLALDMLNRDIRTFAGSLFGPEITYAQSDLVASLIEEADFTASLVTSLHQVARRVKRETFGPTGQGIVNEALERLELNLRRILLEGRPQSEAELHLGTVEELRYRLLSSGLQTKAEERATICAFLGSIERAVALIERIHAERTSVDRSDPYGTRFSLEMIESELA